MKILPNRPHLLHIATDTWMKLFGGKDPEYNPAAGPVDVQIMAYLERHHGDLSNEEKNAICEVVIPEALR